jgi:hypothetical protein
VKFAKFEFVNFKGIKSASVWLLPAEGKSNIATLVGLNESGKTTILEAIDQFYPGEVDEEIKPKNLLGIVDQDPFDFIPIASRGNFNDSIEIIATVRLDDADKEFIRKGVARSATKFRVTSLPDEIEITNRYTFTSSKLTESATLWPSLLGEGVTPQGKVTHRITAGGRRMDWRTVINEVRKLMPRIWYFPNFLFDFPEEVQLTQSDDETPENRLFRNLMQDILSSVDPNATIQEHIVDRAVSSAGSDRASLGQIRSSIGGEVTKSVVARWNEMFGGSAMEGKRIFFEVEASPSGVVTGKFVLEDGIEMFSIRERSLGFRWFFVYLLLTTYRARRPEHGGIVCLLDEPASNLHSSAQRVLLDSLQRIGEDAQIIYTTHSQHLINPKWLESTFVVANGAADPSKITAEVLSRRTDISISRYPDFAYQHPGKQHYFQPVLDVLAYRPTDLELVPDVVMTEGKSDYYLLEYYIQVLSDSSSKIHLMPGRGSGSLDEVIRLYLGWGRNFVVLLDSDKGGEDAIKHYGKEFGRIAQERLLGLAQVCQDPTTKTIESLLAEEDRLAFQRLVDPDASTWNKRAWSQGVEHALAVGSRVVLSKAASTRLAATVSALENELRMRRDALPGA